MEVLGKIWGQTSPLFCKNNVEIHRIQINKDAKCSKHKHLCKFNLFYVEKGKLEVLVWKNKYDLVDKTVLFAQQSTIVPPGEYHQFHALENTIAYEIYWVELCAEDIHRENVGSLS